jgi:dolichol-phosphate mannosyltransferase
VPVVVAPAAQQVLRLAAPHGLERKEFTPSTLSWAFQRPGRGLTIERGGTSEPPSDQPAPSLPLSVIVPVYNEADSLPLLWEELDKALRTLREPAEVIFVDDGSTDGSADVLRSIVKLSQARLIRLATNAGLTAALHAGFNAARGRIIVTMDADLQYDPRDIGMLLTHLSSADAVVGWRRDRRDTWVKRVSSRIANLIRAAVTDDHVRDSACTLRAMRRECIEAIPPYNGMHRFVPTLLKIAGYHVVEIPVGHRPRRFGQSKFGVRNRAFRALQDLLAVLWMARRRLRYDVAEDVVGG